MKLANSIFSIFFGVLMIFGTLILVLFMMLKILPGADSIGAYNINGVYEQIKLASTKLFNEGFIDALFPWGIMGLTIGSGFFFTLFTWRKPAVYTNLYICFLTYVAALLIIVIAGGVFVLAGEFPTIGISLTAISKIGIGVCLFSYILVRSLGTKVNTIIERKIQAYENTMELKQVGRSNPIVINILKTLSFMFPEVIIITLLAILNKTLAPYFLSIFVTAGIITFGKIWRDLNKRRESKRRILVNKINQAKAVAALIDGKASDSATPNE
jgi:hypothetical protein